MKKLLYLIIDGMGGLPVPVLGNRTALGAASTPHMDRLAQEGQTGLMYPVGKGIAPESDVAVLSILGYDVDRYYTGRGPLEAFGAGVQVKTGDLAWRGNFATVDGNRIVDRRVGRSLTDAESAALGDEIRLEVDLPGATYDFKPTVGHRAVLVIRSLHGALSAQVDNTDPGYVRHGPYSVAVPNPSDIVQPCRPLTDDPRAVAAAALTSGFVDASHVVLANSPVNKRRIQRGLLPANIVLLRDAGDRLPDLPSLRSEFGMRFASVVEMPVERGIAALTGMQEIVVPGLAGRPERDYPKQARAALATLPDCDAEYIHLKGPDVFGHDGEARGKMLSIENIDRYFFGELLPAIDPDQFVIAVTADHATPATLKAHSADPVPVLIRAPGLPSDGSQRFDEEVCSHGRLGIIMGPELLPKLVGLARQ